VTDQEIIKSILDGDQSAFAELIQRYQRQILVYCLRLLNFHHEDAEDVVSDTFLKVYVNLAGYNPSLKFSSWLYRIAHNEAVNLIAKKSKYRLNPIESEENNLSVTIDFEKPNTADIELILSKLAVDDRNVLTLFYLEEKSLKEIGEIMKISDNNVAVKLNRARTRAKKFVQ
jgi:RNA polymerase sigma-70 factor, ECF subfamily